MKLRADSLRVIASIVAAVVAAKKKNPSPSPTPSSGGGSGVKAGAASADPSPLMAALISPITLGAVAVFAIAVGGWAYGMSRKGKTPPEIMAAVRTILGQLAADQSTFRVGEREIRRGPVMWGGVFAFLGLGVLIPPILPFALAVAVVVVLMQGFKANAFLAAQNAVAMDLFAVGREHLSWPRNIPDSMANEYVLITEWDGLLPLAATVRIGPRDATRSDNKKAVFASEFAAAAGGGYKWVFEWAPKDDSGKAMMVAVGQAEEDLALEQRMHVEQIFTYCKDSGERLNWPSDATIECADLYVRVTRWNGDEPLEVVIRVSPKDASRSVNDKARFAAGFTAAMRSNKQWVFRWDTQKNIAHGRAVKPLSPHRRGRIEKMFGVASANLNWPTGTTVDCADSYIKVTKWQGQEPAEVEITIGAKDVSKNDVSRADFERVFSDAMSEDRRWVFEWFPSELMIRGVPTPPLPRMANLPVHDEHPWFEFPIGVGAGSTELFWDVSQYPHSLIVGTTGSGKSVVQRAILSHCLKMPDEWEVVLIDPKRVELDGYSVFAMSQGLGGVVAIATELQEQVELLERAKDIMDQRYRAMRDAGVNHANDYVDPATGRSPRALLLMVDEAFQLLAPEQGSSDQIKENNELHGRASIAMGSIARLGRAAKVHMVVATQRPDAKVLSGELKANLDCRIGMGRMDSIPSLMAFDSDAGTFTSPVKGRAKMRQGGLPQEFQGYWLDPKDTMSHIRRGMTLRGVDLGELFPATYSGPAGNDEFPLEDRDELMEELADEKAARRRKEPELPIEVVPNPFDAAFSAANPWGAENAPARGGVEFEDEAPSTRRSRTSKKASGLLAKVHSAMYGD